MKKDIYWAGKKVGREGEKKQMQISKSAGILMLHVYVFILKIIHCIKPLYVHINSSADALFDITYESVQITTFITIDTCS